jgi:hypothetical protein
MKKSIAILASLFFSGAALASTPDLATDIVHGGAEVKTSPSQMFVSNGPEVDGSTDALYIAGFGEASSSEPADARVADSHEISTDLIYGS